MSACRRAAVDLYTRLASDERFITPLEPELDIVIWTPRGKSASEISKLSQTFFEKAAARHLHLAVTKLPTQFFDDDIEKDQEKVACLRSCLMKPVHRDWLDTIYQLIDETCAELSP
jgi:hypothetical protein